LSLSGLQEALSAEDTDESTERLENLREFVGAAEEWDKTYAPEEDPEGVVSETPLAAFLAQISLLGDADQKTDGPRVSLMTLHTAKGLEFEEVFLTGMEEGVFPHSRALGYEADEELAEERRLCYVGFTRAKKRLTVSLAKSRALYGELRFNDPSRFLGDVPKELFAVHAESDRREQRSSYRIEYDVPAKQAIPPIRRSFGEELRGARVRHAQFGEGVVLGGESGKLSVRFASVGVKKVLSKFLDPL
jgi:DNA helicase-2/ATP-dependent DNA helicase PcrA